MSDVILTSCLDFYKKDENGNKTVHHFGNINGILDCLKSRIKKYDNFLFVASGMDACEVEIYFNNTCKSFHGDARCRCRFHSVLSRHTSP